MKKISIILLALLICSIGLVGCDDIHEAKPIEKYDVISVYIYEKPITNNYGGVRDVEIKYYFSYLDTDGKLKHVDSFDHSLANEYVTLGETNTYVYDPNTNSRILYLTEETIQNLQKVSK